MPYIFLNLVEGITNIYMPTPIIASGNSLRDFSLFRNNSVNILSEYKGPIRMCLFVAYFSGILDLLEERGYIPIKISHEAGHCIWILYKPSEAKRSGTSQTYAADTHNNNKERSVKDNNHDGSSSHDVTKENILNSRSSPIIKSKDKSTCKLMAGGDSVNVHNFDLHNRLYNKSTMKIIGERASAVDRKVTRDRMDSCMCLDRFNVALKPNLNEHFASKSVVYVTDPGDTTSSDDESIEIIAKGVEINSKTCSREVKQNFRNAKRETLEDVNSSVLQKLSNKSCSEENSDSISVVSGDSFVSLGCLFVCDEEKSTDCLNDQQGREQKAIEGHKDTDSTTQKPFKLETYSKEHENLKASLLDKESRLNMFRSRKQGNCYKQPAFRSSNPAVVRSFKQPNQTKQLRKPATAVELTNENKHMTLSKNHMTNNMISRFTRTSPNFPRSFKTCGSSQSSQNNSYFSKKMENTEHLK